MFKKLKSLITKRNKLSQKESSHGHTNVENEPNNSQSGNGQLQQTKDIPGTPFHVIKFQNHGWIICCGNLRDDTEYKTADEAIIQVKQKNWKHITLLIEVLMKHALKNKNG